MSRNQFKKKQNSIQFVITYILFVFFFIFSILSIFWLNNRNEKKTSNYINNISGGRAKMVYQLIQGDLQFLRGVATAAPFDSMSSEEQMKELINDVNISNRFIRIGLADTSSMIDFVNQDGTVTNHWDLSGYGFFQKALEGNASVSETIYDDYTRQNVNYYAVPVFFPNSVEVRSVLCAVSTSEALLNILNEAMGEDEYYFTLVDSEGIIVSPIADTVSIIQTGSNIFETANFKQPDLLRHTLQTERGGNFEMETTMLYRKITVAPLRINGWSILCVVPQKTIDLYHNISFILLIVIVLATCILSLISWQLRLFSRNNQTLERLAYIDPVTGMRNYTKFLLDAQEILQTPSKKKYAIWSADLKKFRLINSIYGNAVGDRVLQRLSTIFAEEGGKNDIFCRISADQFAGIHEYTHKHELELWFQRIETRAADRKVLAANQVYSGAAFGLYCLEDFAVHPAIPDMVSNAAIAKKAAKEQLDSQTCFFTAEMGEQARQEIVLEANGKSALEKGEITFFVQPKVTIQDGFSIVGGEVLMRWQHPVMGWISPGKFIPLFENNGFIVEADRYLFEQACIWYAKCNKQDIPAFQLAVNVSRQGLLRNDFIEHYVSVKEKYGIADGILELEFTESTPMDDYKLFHNLTLELQNHGFICSIDDFGSGYSSLNVLKELPVNVLKLDAVFFKKDMNTPKEKIIVSDFIRTAQKLHIKVVAEGIENPAQVEFLQSVGCDMIQGYVFCKPLPQETFIDKLTKKGGQIEMQQTVHA